MSHRGPLTAVITTVLGATLGGLLIWRVYRTKRRKLPSVQKAADPVEAPCPVEKEFPAVEFQLTETPFQAKELKAVECQTTQLPPLQIPSSEQLLGAKPVMVSSEEEWLQLWPLMQKELSVLPVLGLDCEWVKVTAVRNAFLMILYTKRKNNIYPNISKLLLFFLTLLQVSVKGRASAVSLLQMATYTGLCVLVRLQAFRSGLQTFPLSLMEVLRDPHILKVGVGCYEDGKRLTRDYGLSMTCTVDLRYLALRQR